MTTPLEEKAAIAWAAMFNHAMPAATAVKLLAEPAGDRVKVAEAIVAAAVVDMANSRPGAGNPTGATWADAEAGLITAAILLGKFAVAAVHRHDLAIRLIRMEVAGDAFAGPWLDWCEHMGRAIDLCRAVTAEATAPETAK